MAYKLTFIFFCTLLSGIGYGQQKGYYRNPCIHQNTVIFTAEGDLWKYDIATGYTARITTNSGLEVEPCISPNGKQIVFTGQYEGASDLYIMNIDGGVPKRITYDFGGRAIHACGWTKDGKILYRTMGYSPVPSTQLYTINPLTLAKEPVPLWQASYGCYDDAGVLYFTRFPNQGSLTKRYKGGDIEQIWKFNGTQEASNLTGDFDGTSTYPMVYNNRIYFLSDRDGTMNIWSMDKDGKDLKQQTFSKGWDVQTPSIDGSKIVYEKGADIWLYDINSNEEKMLDINIVSDFDQRKPKWIKSPVKEISYADISPNGNYAAIISRGRIFVSPSKSDRWVEVNRKSGIRFKEVHFINDKSIAALSDASGEYEVWKMNADGSDTATQITKNSKTIISSFKFSPDEKYIAYTDKNDVLHIAEVSSGTRKFVDSAYSGIGELGWSPDSRLFNYTRGLDNLNSQICVVDMQTIKMTPLTTSRLNSYNPAWSADSNWLYFVSERYLASQIRSPWGSRQPEPVYTNAAKIYAMPLDSAVKFPFLQTDSWLTDSVFNPLAENVQAKNDKSKKDKNAKQAAKNYNWDHIKNMLFEVPVKNANIGNLAAAAGYLYWLEAPSDQNNDSGSKMYSIKIEESKKYEPTEVATGVNSFNLSADGKKLLVNFKDQTLAIADANGSKIDKEKAKLQLDNWTFVIDPQQEWTQMFNDAWRMMRDYFYDRDLHKVNWLAIKQQYEPLVARVTDRDELDNLLGQMVGELSALHTFVFGGDKRRSQDMIQAGFLGATFTKMPTGFRIDHIYKSDPDYPDFSSPLNKPELKIKEGDIITAINNAPLNEVSDMAELLANKVKIPVKLSLLDKSNKPYEQVVRPCSDEDAFTLRYEEWELANREKVDNLSNNKIGYVHLKAMTGTDMDDFVKQFYPVFNREGLILDVRDNFGGNIDSWVLEKLIRKAWMYWQGRSGGPTWNMQYAFRGHMVILCNQQTSSDGEAITEGFRRLGLGKVIGMRTWGGEIWLSADNRLVDNGIATAAEYGVYGPEGKWLIEGRGVEPDITIDDLPYETYKGKDAQLEFAIDYLQKQIKADPVTVPAAPQHPDKSFDYGDHK